MTQTNTLPVDNVIDVTVVPSASGLKNKNVNVLCLMTQDAPINGEAFGIYKSPTQLAGNYPSGSRTVQAGTNIFAQRPNLLSGSGYLVVIPMINAVSATAGTFSTANIAANLAAIKAVTNGSLKVNLDGVTQTYSGMNFTNCTTWADVAAVLQTYFNDCDFTALANGIKITSHQVGTNSTCTLSDGTTGTNLNAAGYLSGATGVSAAGANSTGEDLYTCYNRTIAQVMYVGVMSTLDLDDAATETAASNFEGVDVLFFDHKATSKAIAGIGTTVQQAGQTRARILVHTAGLLQSFLYCAAYASRLCSVDFTGSKTSSTMNLKSLVNILPDTGISQTLYNAADVAGVDVYVSYEGVPCVFSTEGNDFADNPYSDLAVKFYMQTASFNYLRQTNTKVPQTEAGMTGYKDAQRKVCRQFVKNGCWAPGAWTAADTFGDPVIFVNNVAAEGFYIYSDPVSDQNTADREARIAPISQIAFKRAGAIQKGNIILNANA